MVYVCYIFYTPPMFFNQQVLEQSKQNQPLAFEQMQHVFDSNQLLQKHTALLLVQNLKQNDAAAIANQTHTMQQLESNKIAIRDSVKTLIKQNNKQADTNDSNYIFLGFVINYLPKGIIGLLVAIIFLSAMGATASGLNALTSTCIVDFYKPVVANASAGHYLKASRWVTFIWGVFCIITAMYASRLGNLIEAVNIMGSLFYGTILGIFCVAIFCKVVGSVAVFYAAIIAEILVVISWWYDVMAFLWLNVLGCLCVVCLALFIQWILNFLTKQEKVI